MAWDNLKKRILTGVVLVIVISLGISISRVSFILLILAINILTITEFYRLFNSPAVLPRKLAGVVLSVCILVTASILFTGKGDWKILLLSIPLVFAVFIGELYLKADNPFHNLAFTFLGIICITIPLCFFISIAFWPVGQYIYQPRIMLGYFFILWASDTGAYFVGKYFGKHHLFERISPKKTWEGSLGGLASALLIAYVTSYFFTTINFSGWLVMAFIIVVAGTFGDLIKSLMKRSLHIKDSGNILPGHGGMLDRFDTLLGSAPFVSCYLILYTYA
jgi:phosphatidate cytidylyltransferase